MQIAVNEMGYVKCAAKMEKNTISTYPIYGIEDYNENFIKAYWTEMI